MTNDEVIDHLKEPIRLPLTKWEKFQRVCAVISVVAFVVGGVAAIFAWTATARSEAASTAARAQSQRSVQISTCINLDLGKRNKPTVDESNALKAYAAAAKVYALSESSFFSSLNAVLTAPPAQAKADYALFLPMLASFKAASVVYSRATTDLSVALDAVQDARSKTPLGKC